MNNFRFLFVKVIFICNRILNIVLPWEVRVFRTTTFLFLVIGNNFPNKWIFFRIVRNKAAEKAKHAHQQQQAQQQGQQQQGQPGTGGSVSVIAHAPATPSGHPAVTAPNAYSISGILGIPPHHQDPNGNSIKRKRTDDGNVLFNSYFSLNFNGDSVKILFLYWYTNRWNITHIKFYNVMDKNFK